MAMAKEREHADAEILALRNKYREKQAGHITDNRKILIGTDSVPLYKELLFGGICSIMLPETMTDMDEIERMVRYQNRNRPPVIKTDADREASMTFSILSPADAGNTISVPGQLAQIRSDMKKIWKQNVFYDTGEVVADGSCVAWMDFRAYCLDGNLYSMVFLFHVGKQTVLGNFHCSFPRYDAWKPAVLRLLATVRV